MIWNELGIEATRDVQAIKHAFALRSRDCHPEDDPAGFARLRQAYKLALRFAQAGKPVEAQLFVVAEEALAMRQKPAARPTPADDYDFDEVIDAAAANWQQEMAAYLHHLRDVCANRRRSKKAMRELLAHPTFRKGREEPTFALQFLAQLSQTLVSWGVWRDVLEQPLREWQTEWSGLVHVRFAGVIRLYEGLQPHPQIIWMVMGVVYFGFAYMITASQRGGNPTAKTGYIVVMAVVSALCLGAFVHSCLTPPKRK